MSRLVDVQLDVNEGGGVLVSVKSLQDHQSVEAIDVRDIEAVVAAVARLGLQESPENNPFESQYQARKLIQWAIERAHIDGLDHSVAMARLQQMLGINFCETEELSAGDKALTRALELFKQCGSDGCERDLIEAYNQLGILWSNRSEHEKGRDLLLHANSVYSLFQARAASAPKAEVEKVEALHTLTLFYLAQVYGHLSEPNLSAKFCQLTLSRQLAADEMVPLEWAKNATQLSFYHLHRGNHRLAFHCLSAAEAVAPKLPPPEQRTDEDETLEMLWAHIHRSWGRFYAYWLSHSADLLLLKQNPVKELDEPKTDSAATAEEKQRVQKERESQAPTDSSASTPPSVDEKEVQAGEELIEFAPLKLAQPPPCTPASTFAEARDIFKGGLLACMKALKFYKLDGWVSEHVETLQEVSNLYKQLVVFEPDMTRQCKMHRRRIIHLEPLVDQLNPNVFGNYTKQLSDEVARAYGAMAELKLLLQQQSGNEAATDKINELLLAAIRHHQFFIKCFETRDRKPKDIEEAYHRPYWAALFAIARLFSKVYSPNPRVLCVFLQKSADAYQYLLDWAKAVKCAEFGEETAFCEQMVELLPLKIKRIQETGVCFR